MHELGYSSDDSIVDDLISALKFYKDEEKDLISLEESIEDDEKINANSNLNSKPNNDGRNNKKRNINRRSLLFDRATNSWYDKNDKFFKFKKLINGMASCKEINTSELPKIIFKNIDAVNWSYNDIYIALEEFIGEMTKLGNKKWGKLKSSDIIDYRVHIPYNVIPQELLEQQIEKKEESEQKKQNGKSEIENKNENEIEMDNKNKNNNNNESEKMGQWITNRIKIVSKDGYKQDKAKDQWTVQDKRPIKIKTIMESKPIRSTNGIE